MVLFSKVQKIYGGLSGTWDWGPLGVALKNNIKKLWWLRFVESRDICTVLTLPPHEPESLAGKWARFGFSDPLVECSKCKRRFRADHIEGDKTKCPECGGKLGEPRQFNMMFKTHVGAMEDETSVSSLRPNCSGYVCEFQNVIDSFHPKLPFGLAQIGKGISK